MEKSWMTLLESTFNRVSDILREPCVEDDFMHVEEDVIEKAVTLDTLSDSRLDANSVLIEDIDLGILEGTGKRDRSNTWHGKHATARLGKNSDDIIGASGSYLSNNDLMEGKLYLEKEDYFNDGSSQTSDGSDELKSKVTCRKNPWGNQSYAELIVQAIQSSPEGRLTLAQIYDWMIATVPYFGERADSSSAAGWKNSIRHNLSLHQRFLKVQNGGAGKSSWWMINPEKRIGGKPRRRATSGDVRAMNMRREKARRRSEIYHELPFSRQLHRSISCRSYSSSTSHPPSLADMRISPAATETVIIPRKMPDYGSNVEYKEPDNTQHKLKILEPRQSSPTRDATSVQTLLKHNDEVNGSQTGKNDDLTNLDWAKMQMTQTLQRPSNLETSFDIKIRLLQKELDKLSREEEILNINHYSSISNNPYFIGGDSSMYKEASSMYTLRPRDDKEDIMKTVIEQELSFSNCQQRPQYERLTVS